MTSQAVFGIFPGQNSSFSYFLSNLTEIWHRSKFWGADFEFELKKPIGIPFEREKGNFFTKKLEILPKRSLTKALPW